MADIIQFLKGKKSGLPTSGATPGAMYCCLDTGGIYIANESGVPTLIANIDTGVTSIGSSGSGNAVTSMSYNTTTRKLTYSLGNSFLPLQGGNMTGHIYLTGAQANSSTASTSQIVFGTEANNHVVISSNTNAIVINPDTSSTTNQIVLYLDKSSLFPSGITANLTGNASTATKFAAAQKIALTGDVTGSVSSQAGWSIATTLSNSGVAAGSYGQSASSAPGFGGTFVVPYITVDAKGRITSASSSTITMPSVGNGKITLSAGNGLTNGGSFTTNQSTSGTITFHVGAGVGISVTDDAVNLATSGVAAGSYGPSTAVAGSHNTTVSIPYITVDAYGRVTNISNTTYTSKDTTYSAATQSAAGLMSAADKKKLDGIATGAEVNQNAFSHVTVGSTNISADSKTDTLILAAGSNITLTPDATNDKITIAATDTTYSAATQSNAGLMSAADKKKLDGIATGANNYTYTLPAATSSTLGGVKIGSNISVSSGTISLTKANVTAALGYTPPTTDTNTHYTTKLFATSSSGTAHAATANGGTYLRLFDDSTARQSIKITGSGATTVTSDANGVITINSTDNNTDTKNTAGSTNTNSKIFLIGATSQAANPQTYSDSDVFVTDGVLSAKRFDGTLLSTQLGTDGSAVNFNNYFEYYGFKFYAVSSNATLTNAPGGVTSGRFALMTFPLSSSKQVQLAVNQNSNVFIRQGSQSSATGDATWTQLATTTQVDSKAPAYRYSTADLVAGQSELAAGTLYFVYE